MGKTESLVSAKRDNSNKQIHSHSQRLEMGKELVEWEKKKEGRNEGKERRKERKGGRKTKEKRYFPMNIFPSYISNQQRAREGVKYGLNKDFTY